MTAITVATVELTLGDKTFTLTPTLRALEQVCTRFGGIDQAMTACRSMNVQGLTQLVRIGAKASDADTKGLPELIYQAGLPTVAAEVVRFLAILMNGGRPLDEEEAAPTEEGQGEA